MYKCDTFKGSRSEYYHRRRMEMAEKLEDEPEERSISSIYQLPTELNNFRAGIITENTFTVIRESIVSAESVDAFSPFIDLLKEYSASYTAEVLGIVIQIFKHSKCNDSTEQLLAMTLELMDSAENTRLALKAFVFATVIRTGLESQLYDSIYRMLTGTCDPETIIYCLLIVDNFLQNSILTEEAFTLFPVFVHCMFHVNRKIRYESTRIVDLILSSKAGFEYFMCNSQCQMRFMVDILFVQSADIGKYSYNIAKILISHGFRRIFNTEETLNRLNIFITYNEKSIPSDFFVVFNLLLEDYWKEAFQLSMIDSIIQFISDGAFEVKVNALYTFLLFLQYADIQCFMDRYDGLETFSLLYWNMEAMDASTLRLFLCFMNKYIVAAGSLGYFKDFDFVGMISNMASEDDDGICAEMVRVLTVTS